jgi:hypothetical protein
MEENHMRGGTGLEGDSTGKEMGRGRKRRCDGSKARGKA